MIGRNNPATSGDRARLETPIAGKFRAPTSRLASSRALPSSASETGRTDRQSRRKNRTPRNSPRITTSVPQSHIRRMATTADRNGSAGAVFACREYPVARSTVGDWGSAVATLSRTASAWAGPVRCVGRIVSGAADAAGSSRKRAWPCPVCILREGLTSSGNSGARAVPSAISKGTLMNDLPDAINPTARNGLASDATRADSRTQWRMAGRRLRNRETIQAVAVTRITVAAAIAQKSRTKCPGYQFASANMMSHLYCGGLVALASSSIVRMRFSSCGERPR